MMELWRRWWMKEGGNKIDQPPLPVIYNFSEWSWWCFREGTLWGRGGANGWRRSDEGQPLFLLQYPLPSRDGRLVMFVCLERLTRNHRQPRYLWYRCPNRNIHPGSHQSNSSPRCWLPWQDRRFWDAEPRHCLSEYFTALLISAIIQAKTFGLSSYHAMIVLFLSWINNTSAMTPFAYILGNQTYIPKSRLHEEIGRRNNRQREVT